MIKQPFFSGTGADKDRGYILRIEKASIHDGEGLRSVVFFKGCPLECGWCSTPESQRFKPEIGIDPLKCTHCGACVESCPSSALFMEEGFPRVLREKCTGCFKCAEACMSKAVKKYGATCTVEEIADEVSKDEIFYFHSGGGVTLSGGEPCAQPRYAADLLREMRSRGIHTTIETSLYADWENVRMLLPYLNCVLADVKHMDTVQHKKWTGVGNELILENLVKIDASHFPICLTIRVPLIPGINDSDENLRALAEFCRSLKKLQAIELLPYHRLGSDTYRLLNRVYAIESVAAQSSEELEERASFLCSCRPGVLVVAGGREFK